MDSKASLEKVLLLNGSYEPIRAISHRRAIVLILQEKAEIIEITNKKIKSERQSFDLPSVVRLKYYVKIPHKAKIPLNKRSVMLRDKNRCQFAHCGRKATTVDHVIPRSRGGKHVWENVVGACQKCNSKKSDKLLCEIGWELKTTPRQPIWNLWLAGCENRTDWQPYLEPYTPNYG